MNPLFFADFREPAAVGVVADVPVVRDDDDQCIGDSGPALAALAAAFPHLTFLVHGFNISRADGMSAYRAFVTRVAGAALPTCFVGVLWPGNAPIINALSYPFEEVPADRTGERLAACLGDLVRPRSMSIVAHSLGCRVTLRALTLLDPTVSVDQAVLLAGAIDCDALARSDRYRFGVSRVGRAVVVSSTADRVLEWAFPVGDFVASLLFGGYTLPALGRVGARPSRSEGLPGDVTGISLGTRENVDHGDYLPSVPSEKASGIANLAADALAGLGAPAYRA